MMRTAEILHAAEAVVVISVLTAALLTSCGQQERGGYPQGRDVGQGSYVPPTYAPDHGKRWPK